MKHLTILTDFDTGEECFLDLDKASSIERLPAYHEDGDECAARTKIVIGRQIHLVQETVKEVQQAYQSATR